MNGISTNLLYDPALFVNRETEIRSVHAAIDKLASGDSVDRRTIQFEGLRGGGKSWLAFHLHRKELAERMDVKSLLFAFDTQNRELKGKNEWHYSKCISVKDSTIAPDEFAKSILRFACQQLAAANVENASLEERITWLVRRIKESQPGKVFVFTFDSVSELDSILLEKLESAFLASVAELSNVLIILTGRPPQPLWSSLRLRFYVHHIFLKPLSQESLTKALQLRAKGTVSDIEGIVQRAYKESRGNPGAFMHLASVAPSRTADELSRILDEQLNMFSSQTDRAAARSTIEAICVLQVGFREEEILILLTAYHEFFGTSRSASDARAGWKTLQDRRILNWDFAKRGFVLDEAIRGMVEEYLRIGKPKLWTKLHETAIQMYEGYAKASPKWQAVYLENAAQHRRALNILNEPKQSDIPSQSNAIDDDSTSQSYPVLTTS